MQKTTIKRSFTIQVKHNERIVLTDPNADYSPDEVMAFYSNAYPELVNATFEEEPIKGNTINYLFKTTVGTKG